MSIVNGDFEDGQPPWNFFQNASISTLDAVSGVNSLRMDSKWTTDPKTGATVDQTFAVAAGQVLTGWIKLWLSQDPRWYTEVRVLWKGVPVFSIDTDTLVVGVWVPFVIPFFASETGEFKLNLQLGPPVIGIPAFGSQHIFLVDALVIPEGSMIAESLMKWIDAEDFGFGTESTDLFTSWMPDKPDDVVVVYDESSGALSESQALAYDRFGIEVRVRNTDYATARDRLMTIHRALAAFSGLLAPGTPEVIMVDVVTSPTYMMRDDDNRSVWVAHYALLVVSTGDQFRS